MQYGQWRRSRTFPFVFLRKGSITFALVTVIEKALTASARLAAAATSTPTRGTVFLHLCEHVSGLFCLVCRLGILRGQSANVRLLIVRWLIGLLNLTQAHCYPSALEADYHFRP